MSVPTMKKLTVFVPARDFALSRAFYEAMGWRCAFATDDVASMVSDAGSFLLQDFYEKALAENLMLRIDVDDADAWAAHVRGLVAEGRFPGVRVMDTRDEPWGDRVTYVVDPSGVLLHLAQAR